MEPLLRITPGTWIISDTHFGHKNIVKYCDRPMHHNSLMIAEWHKRVADDDVVLHLGDLAVWYGDEEIEWLDKAGELPGKKFMLRGNHDKRKDSQYAKRGFTVIPEFIQTIDLSDGCSCSGGDSCGGFVCGDQRVLFSHFPDETRVGEWDINIHGHIHNNPLEPRLAATNRRYVNVSVELMGYRPVKLCDIIQP